MVVGFRYLHRKDKSVELEMIKEFIRQQRLGIFDNDGPRAYELDVESLRVSLLMSQSTIDERVDLT